MLEDLVVVGLLHDVVEHDPQGLALVIEHIFLRHLFEPFRVVFVEFVRVCFFKAAHIYLLVDVPVCDDVRADKIRGRMVFCEGRTAYCVLRKGATKYAVRNPKQPLNSPSVSRG